MKAALFLEIEFRIARRFALKSRRSSEMIAEDTAM
jgi:hypothetical protein